MVTHPQRPFGQETRGARYRTGPLHRHQLPPIIRYPTASERINCNTLHYFPSPVDAISSQVRKILHFPGRYSRLTIVNPLQPQGLGEGSSRARLLQQGRRRGTPSAVQRRATSIEGKTCACTLDLPCRFF